MILKYNDYINENTNQCISKEDLLILRDRDITNYTYNRQSNLIDIEEDLVYRFKSSNDQKITDLPK